MRKPAIFLIAVVLGATWIHPVHAKKNPNPEVRAAAQKRAKAQQKALKKYVKAQQKERKRLERRCGNTRSTQPRRWCGGTGLQPGGLGSRYNCPPERAEAESAGALVASEVAIINEGFGGEGGGYTADDFKVFPCCGRKV